MVAQECYQDSVSSLLPFLVCNVFSLMLFTLSQDGSWNLRTYFHLRLKGGGSTSRSSWICSFSKVNKCFLRSHCSDFLLCLIGQNWVSDHSSSREKLSFSHTENEKIWDFFQLLNWGVMKKRAIISCWVSQLSVCFAHWLWFISSLLCFC